MRRDQVFEKLGDGHEVDEAVALFAAKRLVSETLGEEDMRHEPGWVCFDDGKDKDGQEDVSGNGRGNSCGRRRAFDGGLLVR